VLSGSGRLDSEAREEIGDGGDLEPSSGTGSATAYRATPWITSSLPDRPVHVPGGERDPYGERDKRKDGATDEKPCT
jgi:hypothetical protein